MTTQIEPVNEQVARVNGLAIAHETIGDPQDRPLLLVMGLGMQLIHWDRRFCEALAERGFFVVRFDNRDVGRSTKIENGPRPRVAAALVGNKRSAGYTLDEMAADASGLIDHLGLEAAHVVGVSMGGMIAQQAAVRHPDKVLSLCTIMSSTGSRTVIPRLSALAALLSRPPADRDDYVEYILRIFRRIGSPGFPVDEARLRELAAAGYDRCYYPEGAERQLVGILASGNRTRQLRGIRCPTVVVHGREDPLVPVRAGVATRKAIPGAELVVIPGMGHSLPEGAWPHVLDAIAANADRATAPAVLAGIQG
jgi:pimeloyl-ACP methyl ester carboxylesterase